MVIGYLPATPGSKRPFDTDPIVLAIILQEKKHRKPWIPIIKGN
jgi:hypothetical protein